MSTTALVLVLIFVLATATTAFATASATTSLQTDGRCRARVIRCLEKRRCASATDPGAGAIAEARSGGGIECAIYAADATHLHRIQGICSRGRRLTRNPHDRGDSTGPGCRRTRHRARKIKGIAPAALLPPRSSTHTGEAKTSCRKAHLPKPRSGQTGGRRDNFRSIPYRVLGRKRSSETIDLSEATAAMFSSVCLLTSHSLFYCRLEISYPLNSLRQLAVTKTSPFSAAALRRALRRNCCTEPRPIALPSSAKRS